MSCTELYNMLLYDTVINCYTFYKHFQDPFQTHLVEDGLEADEKYEISLLFCNKYTLQIQQPLRFLFWFEVTTNPGGLHAYSLCCF